MKNNKKKNKNKKNGPVTGGADLYTGRLDVTRSGMGFVIVEGQDKDILVILMPSLLLKSTQHIIRMIVITFPEQNHLHHYHNSSREGRSDRL